MASAFPDDADQTLEHKLWQGGNRDLERSEFSVKGHLGSGRARTPARGSLPALGALCLDTLPARRLTHSSREITCPPTCPPAPPRCPPRDLRGARGHREGCPGQRAGGGAGVSPGPRVVVAVRGVRWRRPALTLPAAGAAASSSSSTCTSTSTGTRTGGGRRAGSPRAVQGPMVGTRSESRRVRAPQGRRSGRRAPRAALGRGARLCGGPRRPARGAFCRAPQRRPALPTRAFDGGSEGGEPRLRSRPRPPPLQLTGLCPSDLGVVPGRRGRAARLRARWARGQGEG